MGALITLAKRVNTFAKDTRKHHEEALDGGTIAILPGDPAIASRLSDMLGVPVGERPGADLVVIPLGMADDARAAARETAARARQDRHTLVVVIAPDSRRGAVAWASTVALAAATQRISHQMGEDNLPADPRGAVRSLLARARKRRKEKN